MNKTQYTGPLFLGFDLSTQHLKAVIVTYGSQIICEQSVNFDKDIQHHGTSNGAITGDSPGEITCPVAVWLEALDLLMDKVKNSGLVDMEKIAAISGAAQQHGSVYWSQEANNLFTSLDAAKDLATQLWPKSFSRLDAPIWMDSSTTKECRALEEAVGGPERLAEISGSRAYERFTGPQISKLFRTKPDVYAATARISLVSSFFASLFLCRIAPIERSDASGMNLMNIMSLKWDDSLMKACGGDDLRIKLGEEPVLPAVALGKVGNWWVDRYGFNPECIVAPFTGDNPSTVVSLSSPGDAILSLGTSTTYLLSIPPALSLPLRTVTAHILSHPTTLGGYIAMLCYKNGALAREAIRNRYASSDWKTFNELILSTEAGNSGYMGFYFPLPEIIPPNVLGEYFFRDGKPIDYIQDANHPRAILESQLLSIRSRILSILPHDHQPLKRLILTGGSSGNDIVRQISSDVFNMDVYVAENKEGAGIGGTWLARFAWWKKGGATGTFEDMRADMPDGMKLVARPNPHRVKVYDLLMETYRCCEEQVVAVSNSFRPT